MPISIPTIPEDADLLRFNDLFAHLLKALAGSQGMSAYEINPSKGLTTNRLLYVKFPAIPSTKNERTPLLNIRTVAYIHALVIDTVSLHHSDTPNQRALHTKQLIIDEHGGVDPALWRAEILDCLAGRATTRASSKWRALPVFPRSLRLLVSTVTRRSRS